MWWMPLIALGMNKMQEAKAKEEARKQQTHAIRSQLAGSFGAPGYGPQTAGAIYDTQRQIDADRRRRNSQLLGGVLGSLGSTGGESMPAAGPGVDPPTPDGNDVRTAYEQAELDRSRAALRGLR